MADVDGTRIFRLSLKLSTETLDEAAPEIEALGFEPKAFFVLDGIEERPYPAELARHLSMPKPTLTAYLKNLESRGYVRRSIDPRDLRRHYARLYGTRIDMVVDGATSLDGLGRHFGGTLYEAEARYLVAHEWARSAEDVLWRRTKHRLHLSDAEQAAFAAWFDGTLREAA